MAFSFCICPQVDAFTVWRKRGLKVMIYVKGKKSKRCLPIKSRIWPFVAFNVNEITVLEKPGWYPHWPPLAVSSRLDYCNALLCGAPGATFDKLQRVQNNLARVVCQRGGRADAGPLLRSLLVASSEAAGHVQGRTDDLQGAPHSNAGVSQRSVADPRASTVSAII